MPTASLETLLTCFVMINLVLFSMVGLLTAVQPLIKHQNSSHEEEIALMLAQYILLEAGLPSDWGVNVNATLLSFGLAEEDAAMPFELDIDKVTRLNSGNIYNLSFLEAFTALGTKDKPLKILIRPVFDVTVTLSSRNESPSEITYNFSISTERSNMPVSTSLRCYGVIGDYVTIASSTTSTTGRGTVEISLPKDRNGTALLLVFAELKPKILSYAVYRFIHNLEGSPNQAGEYAALSPLNHTLRADLTSSTDKILYAMVFTYNYWFSLSETEQTSNIQYFEVPKLLDGSPMLLVGTGLNVSTQEHFAEWAAYPQIPLEFGLEFTGRYNLADAYSSRFLVTINGAVYECEVIIGGS